MSYLLLRAREAIMAAIGVSINPIKKVHSVPRRFFFPILSETMSAPAYQNVKTIKKISSCILVIVYE